MWVSGSVDLYRVFHFKGSESPQRLELFDSSLEADRTSKTQNFLKRDEHTWTAWKDGCNWGAGPRLWDQVGGTGQSVKLPH